MVYLLTVTENYRADTEEEASKLLESAKKDNRWSLVKYTSQHKETKNDDYYKVSITKGFTSEKEPYADYTIKYVSAIDGGE